MTNCIAYTMLAWTIDTYGDKEVYNERALVDCTYKQCGTHIDQMRKFVLKNQEDWFGIMRHTKEMI